MLEWMTSKIVVSIAALIVLASLSGFFVIQRENLIDEELRGVAKEIAGTINDVNVINSKATLLVRFGGSDKGTRMPSDIDGDPYKVTIYRDMVICSVGDRTARAFLFESVHLFPPLAVNLSNLTELRTKDLGHPMVETSSQGSFIIMREYVGEGGSRELGTFIFLEV